MNGDIEVGKVEAVSWDDCNGALPYYIILLATEYKLLKKYAGSNSANNALATQTLTELSNAIKAIKRLDIYADGVEDGVFRRSDVKFYEKVDPIDPEWTAVYDHYRNLNGGVKIYLKCEERFGDGSNKDDGYSDDVWFDKLQANRGITKYNSIDNVVKFIEAEAMVSKLLDEDGGTALSISNSLKGSVKKMLENCYHPNEPRAWLDRKKIVSENAFMGRNWYLEDPDLTHHTPDNLIPSSMGGAGEGYTRANSYGYAKVANRLGLDYKSNDFGGALFKWFMNLDLEICEIHTYEILDPFYHPIDTVIYFVRDDGFRINPNPLDWGYYLPLTNERLLDIKDLSIFGDGSLWILRALVATNNINGSYVGLPINPDHHPYNFLKNCHTKYPKLLEQYPLMWSVLNNKDCITDTDRLLVANLLDDAPACGPHNFIHMFPDSSYAYEFKEYEWSCPNRFVWPLQNGIGAGNDRRQGYYNGIDYMLLHNLYWLTKLNSSEYQAISLNSDTVDYPVNVSNESKFAYARNSVKLQPGFKLTINGIGKFMMGTNNNVRTSYDPGNIAFEEVNVTSYESDCNCDPIYRTYFKSATIDGSEFANNSISDEVECQFDLYTNPAIEILNVNATATIKSLEVMSLDGKVLFAFDNLNAKNERLDISNLKVGVYLLKLKTENGYEKIKKFSKAQ